MALNHFRARHFAAASFVALAGGLAVVPEVVSTQQGGSGAGAGGKLSRQAGHFGAAKMGRDGDGYAVDYRHTRAKVLAPVDIEADDEEVVTLLVHMLGEF